MSRTSVIKNGVKKAFAMAGDIVKTVVLTQSKGNSFDFASNDIVTGTISSKPIQGLLVTHRRNRDDTKVSVQQDFLFQSTDLDEISPYDTITDSDGNVWKMVLPFRNDGFIVTVSVNRSQ